MRLTCLGATSACGCVHAYMQLCVHVHAHVWVCMFVCMYVTMCMHVGVYGGGGGGKLFQTCRTWGEPVDV